jgi:hypothetical protein
MLGKWNDGMAPFGQINARGGRGQVGQAEKDKKSIFLGEFRD